MIFSSDYTDWIMFLLGLFVVAVCLYCSTDDIGDFSNQATDLKRSINDIDGVADEAEFKLKERE